MPHGTACNPYYVGDGTWFCLQCGTFTCYADASDPGEFVNKDFKPKGTPYFEDPVKYRQLIEETKPKPKPKPGPIKNPLKQGIEQWF